MTPKPSVSPEAEDQASLWAARLDGSDLSAADRAELQAWLAAHPAHRVLLSSYCQFSADLEKRLPLLAGIKDGWVENTTASPATSPHPWLRWPTWAGAALAAAAVAAVLLWPAGARVETRSLASPVGQRQAATLSDGTHIELNAGTALVAELQGAERRVRLASGEAFFRVARDAARPFYVETPAGSVRVTGTQFNVRSEAAGALEVTVLEGAVQVRPGPAAAPRELHAGDQLVRTDDHVDLRPLAPAQVNEALLWRQGQVVFNGTPLGEALARFARYHGRNLHATGRAAAERVGGRYALDDLNGFLSSLEDVLPVRVNRGLDGSVQVDLRDPQP